MMTLPTRDEAVAYIMEHGLQDLLSRAANACVKADAADPVEFLTERLQEIKEETAVTLPTRAATHIYLKKERGTGTGSSRRRNSAKLFCQFEPALALRCRAVGK